MHDYARLRPGPGFRPLAAALYYSQRLVTGSRARRIVASTLANGIRRRHPLADGGERRWPGVCEALRRDGCAVLGRMLSTEEVDGFRAYLHDKEVVDPKGRRFLADRPPPDARIASYPMATALGYPPVLDWMNRPELLRFVADYLGCKPTISSIGLRWSFPCAVGGEGSAVQSFHRDPDDWRFVKFFIYLTDVDEGSGPHTFVRGTHRTSGQIFARPYAAAELEQRYGADRVMRVTGERGLGFIADTYGIHCGAPPKTRGRLIFQVQYSLLPVYAFLYRPLAPPAGASNGFDPYVNRLILA